ncbi:Uncharacterized protein Fot_23104 [Forsythia ovata]|uniref:Uncharacterized protein n=1 Tax=Forsythia ovata TaxID=205694 RepID=A0ABD1UZK5_9LAMI
MSLDYQLKVDKVLNEVLAVQVSYSGYEGMGGLHAMVHSRPMTANKKKRDKNDRHNSSQDKNEKASTSDGGGEELVQVGGCQTAYMQYFPMDFSPTVPILLHILTSKCISFAQPTVIESKPVTHRVARD